MRYHATIGAEKWFREMNVEGFSLPVLSLLCVLYSPCICVPFKSLPTFRNRCFVTFYAGPMGL